MKESCHVPDLAHDRSVFGPDPMPRVRAVLVDGHPAERQSAAPPLVGLPGRVRRLAGTALTPAGLRGMRPRG